MSRTIFGSLVKLGIASIAVLADMRQPKPEPEQLPPRGGPLVRLEEAAHLLEMMECPHCRAIAEMTCKYVEPEKRIKCIKAVKMATEDKEEITLEEYEALLTDLGIKDKFIKAAKEEFIRAASEGKFE